MVYRNIYFGRVFSCSAGANMWLFKWRMAKMRKTESCSQHRTTCAVCINEIFALKHKREHKRSPLCMLRYVVMFMFSCLHKVGANIRSSFSCSYAALLLLLLPADPDTSLAAGHTTNMME